MHSIIAAALRQLGVELQTAASVAQPSSHGPLCFRVLTRGDLVIGGAKVVGSAQRRLRGALLQHGAILLSASPATPDLPGICEMTGTCLAPATVAIAIRTEWDRQTGWRLTDATWTNSEESRTERLLRSKYFHPAWNYKR
jgi:lipoate-protein ligase A